MSIRNLMLLLCGLIACRSEAQATIDLKCVTIRPHRIAGVKMTNTGRIALTTGWIEYPAFASADEPARLLFDNYERLGRKFSEGPTDGLYGEKYFFSELGEREGTRWLRKGPEYRNVLWVRGIESLFPGGSGARADGVSVIFYQNIFERFYYALLTSDDPTTSEIPDLSSFEGIIYDFGSLPRGLYSTNIDLRGTGLHHQMPDDGQGSLLGMLISDIDPFTYSTQAQPALWGTKPLNPSQISRYMWQDGKDGEGSYNGQFEKDEYLDWKFIPQDNQEYAAIDYVVTRGAEIGENNPRKLAAPDGYFARIQQRFQPAPMLANAEIVFGTRIGADRDLALTRTLRAYVTARANSLPIDDPSCRFEISLRNWETGQFVRRLSVKPTTSFSEVYSFNIDRPVAKEFIHPEDRRVEVRVSAYHLRPLLSSWELQVDAANVFYAYVGPIPLGPCVAFVEALSP